MNIRFLVLVGLIFQEMGSLGPAEEQAFRPPTVPLVVSSPNFSIWSKADRLTDVPTTHWTGSPQRLTGLVRIDGKAFRILGDAPADIPAMPQTSVSVLPTRTIYKFAGAGIDLVLTFMTPVLPDDLMVLARPLTYLSWEVQSSDGGSHEVEVYFDATGELAVNTPAQKVNWARADIPGISVARMGSDAQPVLKRKGDDVRVDWGYLYLATPGSESPVFSITNPEASRAQFIAGGKLTDTMDADMPKAVSSGAPVLAESIDMGLVTSSPVSRYTMLAYDDVYTVSYFWTNLRPYWRKDGAEATDMIKISAEQYPDLLKRCTAFDDELMADLTKEGGEKYATISALAYRQAFGANGLVADANGQPLLIPKENSSNGCMATVDVISPMSPLFLLFGPSLAKALAVPEMEYGSSDRWKPPFAPHDMGKYPIADYPAYGDMPVEESGDLMILVTAICEMDGNGDFAASYRATLAKWAAYLEQYGLDPANQLCTDDFMGPSAHNANLAVKAIVALGAYGKLCEIWGDTENAKKYSDLARSDAQNWMKVDDDGDHYRLQFDLPDTWSMKYNLVWDRMLGLNIFPPDVAKKENAYYKTKLDAFGVPLDSRTELATIRPPLRHLADVDHMFFIAALADNQDDFTFFVSPFYQYLNETSYREPLVDTYNTECAPGTLIPGGGGAGFHARSVVGGIYAKMVVDPDMWKKWASRDATKAANWASLPSSKVDPVAAAGDTDANVVWAYTTEKPADEQWFLPTFDDAPWKRGPAGFGDKDPVRAKWRTNWSTSDIWLRRDFTMPDVAPKNLRLWVHHIQDAEFYINGVEALTQEGALDGYDAVVMTEAAEKSLKPGKNTLAVHCRYLGKKGRQFVDAGLVTMEPR
jgi:hypothetical protein